MPAMSLTPEEQNLLKNPHYAGSYRQIASQVRPMFQPGMHYKLTSVPNTIIACTHCKGNKAHLVKHTDRFGSLTWEKCPICGGHGTISNTREAGR